MVAKRREHESHIETLARLGRQARSEGIQIFWDEVTGRPFATSRRDPSKLHQVSAISCTCPGFIRSGACGHIGLLLLELGYLPTEPTPTPPAASSPAVLCDQCGAPMRYIAGVTFECQCGHTWSADWEHVDRVEMRLCEIDPDKLETLVTQFLTAQGVRQFGPDPDQNPAREDAPDLIGLHNYSANELCATLLWQLDRADVADRMAS